MREKERDKESEAGKIMRGRKREIKRKIRKTERVKSKLFFGMFSLSITPNIKKSEREI